MAHIREIFPGPADLLRLQPEDLGGVLISFVPRVTHTELFRIDSFVPQEIPSPGGPWSREHRPALLAIAEALQWLVSQGLIMVDPFQSSQYYRLTKRGKAIKSPADFDAYRKGGILPMQLLQPRLADKVHHLFVRGDHDVAVFQAFKELEVAVRAACGFGNEVIGKSVMTRAFNIENGPLANMALVPAEREAEMALFVGAIGHAKNPASHRDVNLHRDEAARLIVFASHLLAIVDERSL